MAWLKGTYWLIVLAAVSLGGVVTDRNQPSSTIGMVNLEVRLWPTARISELNPTQPFDFLNGRFMDATASGSCRPTADLRLAYRAVIQSGATL